MSRAHFESVDRICARWQKRYKRLGMGVIKRPKIASRNCHRTQWDGPIRGWYRAIPEFQKAR